MSFSKPTLTITEKTENMTKEEAIAELEKLKKKNSILQGIVTKLKRDTVVNNSCHELSHIRKNVFDTASTSPTPMFLVIDNVYNNPLETRKHILAQDFKVRGNYPGQRTESFATEELKNMIQKWVEPFGGKITKFPTNKDAYNGSFQYTTSRDRSWIHADAWNNWAGVLYMTPDAPVNGGTGIYRFKDGTRFDWETKIRKNKKLTDESSQDVTKWELVDKIGNIFNRLILFNANSFHCSMDYFGNGKEDGRLFQVFFFSTERQQC